MDPRFIGGDGIVFYFHGKKNEYFSLVSDPNLQINARFIGLRPEGRTRDYTWIQALGLLFGSNSFSLEASQASSWDDEIDHLKFTYNGEELVIPESQLSAWQSPENAIRVERTSSKNSVLVTLQEVAEISVNVVPVTKEDDRIHNYQIPSDDCFAHLEVQFRFYGLSSNVEGVLGRTYQPDFKNPAKPGVAMPVVGGEHKYRTTSLVSADCAACVFTKSRKMDQTDSRVMNYGNLDCTRNSFSGNGISMQPPNGKQPPKPPNGQQPPKPPNGKQPLKPPHGEHPLKPPHGEHPPQPPNSKQPLKPPNGEHPPKPPNGKQPPKPPNGKQPPNIKVCYAKKSPKPNCNGPGSACQDPRFIGGDGIVFYFHGKKNEYFSLVSDPNLQINARFIGVRPEGRTKDNTWIQALGLLFDSKSFSLEASKASTWVDEINHLKFTYNGEELIIAESHLSTWESPDNAIIVERTSSKNSVLVILLGVAEISVNVVPVTKEDDRIHNYQLPSDDCFAHLEVQFRFYDLSSNVEGVLGRTYQPDFKNPAKPGIAMPVLGGEHKYRTTSLFSADCTACVVTQPSKLDQTDSRVMDYGMLDCTGNSFGGNGIVCRK
ncbi:unnamed protein product [Malus baccata var. baccata]